VRVRNGDGKTNSTNGKGNLIVGYNERISQEHYGYIHGVR
jgi:hypothetical protein